MELLKDKAKHVFDKTKGTFGYTNTHQAPQLVKVVVSSTFGSARDRKNRQELLMDRLAKITGQKPSVRVAKKSIASFKVREGEPIGVAVTLRGARMYGFVDKLFHVAVPRMRDFRGFERKNIDNIGNLTLGIPEQTIFPETADEDLRDVFGMAITFVTTAKSKEEAEALFDQLGVPFKKKDA